VVFISILNRFY